MTPFDSLDPFEQIVAIMERIYRNGLTTTSGGNLSLLAPDGSLCISPAGIDKGALLPADVVRVRPNGKIACSRKPSSEYPFHRGIYDICPDVKAILHAHPPALVSFSIAGLVPDTAVFPHTKRLCGDVGFAPYELPGSDALGRKISAVFAQGPRTVVLENHGVCLGGNNLLEAYLRFETLDFCARTIYQASLLGGAKPITDAQLAVYSEDKNAAFTPFSPGERSEDEVIYGFETTKFTRRAVRQKLFTGAVGAFAVRIEREKFLVTPADCDRANLQPDELVLIDGTQCEAGKTPDPRTWFFKMVFDAHPDINAVCAANPPAIGAYLISHAEFNPRVIPESFILLRETPAFSFDDALAAPETVARTLSARHPVVLVQNDAVLTCGRTPLEAFDRLEVTDYSAQATIAAQSFGGLRPITDAQVEDLVEAFSLPKE